MEHKSGLARWVALISILVTFALAACSSNQFEKSRGEALKQYETIIRWSQWDAAADFIDFEYQKEHPISRLELDRLRLFKVTSYTVRSTAIGEEGRAMKQVVEIRMFNNHQAVERTIIDNQEWRYNEETEQWKLHSGLPDPTQRY